MWLAIFIIITLLLIAIPLMPGIMELQLATDIKPLKVTQDYDSNAKHFAIGFKAYIDKNFASILEEGDSSVGNPSKEGILRDKTPFIITSNENLSAFDPKEINKGIVKKLLISEHNLVIPDNLLFESEIYAKSSLITGTASRFRAILAEKDITLGEQNIVFRWVHSGNILTINSGCHLFGRASAEENIVILGNCEFERLNAKKIVFGKDTNLPTNAIADKNLHILEKIPHVKDQFERRWLINGDVKIPSNSFFDGDIISTKSVTIGAGSVIKGSIKATKNLIMEDETCIYGSAVSGHDIIMGNKCLVTEPVIAENNIVIGNDNVIGSFSSPVTVTGLNVTIKGGSVVYGSVRAEVKIASVIASLKNPI